ncbi:DNA replication complex GINS protein PSF3 [Trichinella britovi]|uniref:DNA replication complex GINS protein PSF3 n=1 Tax=Trichinella britovi TaxID=45882 RepID=A0A0V1DII7_TRIBR|nr:DNA replication complex GINS protein PSF3 [Trichinella britovi]
MAYFLRMESSYLELVDILATEEKVKVKVNKDIRKLGYLDPNGNRENLPKGFVVELPLWIARELSSGTQPPLNLILPAVFKSGHQQVMSACAELVNLHKASPYYYQFGVHLANCFPSQRTEISSSLKSTFLGRFSWIMNTAVNDARVDKPRTLDAWESEMFDEGRKSYVRFQKWSQGPHTLRFGSNTCINSIENFYVNKCNEPLSRAGSFVTRTGLLTQSTGGFLCAVITSVGFRRLCCPVFRVRALPTVKFQNQQAHSRTTNYRTAIILFRCLRHG